MRILGIFVISPWLGLVPAVAFAAIGCRCRRVMPFARACTFAVVALATGCVSREAEPKRAVPVDTRGSTGAAFERPSSAASPVHSAAIRAGCAGLRAAFDSLAAELQDAAVIESPRDSVAEFPGRLRHGPEYACVTSFEDSTTGASTNEQLHSLLARIGWRMRSELIDAGGPDGETLTFSRSDVVCALHSSWDGGNDDDTTYVPAPGVRIMAVCYADRSNPGDP